MAPMLDELSPSLEVMLEHARDYVARQRTGFADAVDRGLAAARRAVPSAALRWFDACIDHVLNRREIYANQCAGVHFPLPARRRVLPREHFPVDGDAGGSRMSSGRARSCA